MLCALEKNFLEIFTFKIDIKPGNKELVLHSHIHFKQNISEKKILKRNKHVICFEQLGNSLALETGVMAIR